MHETPLAAAAIDKNGIAQMVKVLERLESAVGPAIQREVAERLASLGRVPPEPPPGWRERFRIGLWFWEEPRGLEYEGMLRRGLWTFTLKREERE